MGKFKNNLFLLVLFLPLIILLISDKEFWPLTSFPMYSKPYKYFIWPRVYVKSSSDTNWKTLQNEKCFGRIGYVRFHFSILQFATQKRQTAIDDLTQSLVHEITSRCSDLNLKKLKISLLKFDVKTQAQTIESFIQDITQETKIEI